MQRRDDNKNKLKSRFGMQSPDGDILMVGDFGFINDKVWQCDVELKTKLKANGKFDMKKFLNEKMVMIKIIDGVYHCPKTGEYKEL